MQFFFVERTGMLNSEKCYWINRNMLCPFFASEYFLDYCIKIICWQYKASQMLLDCNLLIVAIDHGRNKNLKNQEHRTLCLTSYSKCGDTCC